MSAFPAHASPRAWSRETRALIAEPTALTREGLAAILGREPDIDLIAATSNGTDTVSAARALLMSPGWQGRDLERAAAAGVRGFLMRDSSPELIIAAVRRLAAGGQMLDPRLSSVTSRARSL